MAAAASQWNGTKWADTGRLLRHAEGRPGQTYLDTYLVYTWDGDLLVHGGDGIF